MKAFKNKSLSQVVFSTFTFNGHSLNVFGCNCFHPEYEEACSHAFVLCNIVNDEGYYEKCQTDRLVDTPLHASLLSLLKKQTNHNLCRFVGMFKDYLKCVICVLLMVFTNVKMFPPKYIHLASATLFLNKRVKLQDKVN